MKTNFRQKAKIGVAGSFFNQLMSNNSSIPELGKGATEMHFTDRTCYEVIKVSKDKKEARLEILVAKYNPELPHDIGHQNWILEQSGRFITVIWKWNGWKTKRTIVRFTKEYIKNCKFDALAKGLTPQQHAAVYGNDIRPKNVIEGLTENAFEYSKINIIFGRKDYYYDWSF